MPTHFHPKNRFVRSENETWLEWLVPGFEKLPTFCQSKIIHFFKNGPEINAKLTPQILRLLVERTHPEKGATLEKLILDHFGKTVIPYSVFEVHT